MRIVPVLLVSGLLSLVLSAAQSSPVSSDVPVAPRAAVPEGQRVIPSVYQQQCTFCHQAKSLKALPDLAAWTRLIYTSGCPEVSLKLADAERKALKAYLEQMLKLPTQ